MKKLVLILMLFIAYSATGQTFTVNTQVRHNDSLFLKTITYTYHFDSVQKYVPSQYLQQVDDTTTIVVYDTVWYYQKFRVIDNVVADSTPINRPSLASLGITEVGRNLTKLTNPNAFSLIRINADNDAVTRTLTEARADLQINNVDNTSDANKPVSTAQQTAIDTKQAALVSGANIKTINGLSLLGSGDVQIAGGEAFPVGSVFISVVSTNPNTLLGYGTWETFGAGRVLIGQDPNDTDFDVAEETGGNKTVTISASNLPQLSVTVTDPGHTHVQNKNTATTGPLSGTTPDASTNSSAASDYSTASSTTGITATANTGGANTALDVMNPYIVVYMWKRTN